MKKILSLTAAAVMMLVLPSLQGRACTNVIVTRGASADGSCMISYAADSHQLYGELYFRHESDWPEGFMKQIREWDTGRPLGSIPEAKHTFQTLGNMNRHQLIIAETTFGGREELVNPDGIMDYGSIIYTTLQRASSAREAIDVIDRLLQEYGYPSEGESFSIADKDEAWIMEIIGKGKLEKGAVWVAIRIPDGYICAHANQSRIHRFPLDDPENCLYSKDVISFARKAGYFSGKDSEFSFCDTYCPLDFGGMRACEARTWSAFRILGGRNFDSEKYLDFAMGLNGENKMPLYIKPEKPVSVTDVAAVMRDHFEGTPMDFSEDVGAGPCRLPYRWRPMHWEVDGKTYLFERSIATQQTGFWFVAQARNWLPDEVGGLFWFGVDDAATSPLTPIYANVTEVPPCFEEGNGSLLQYSESSAFWQVNKVAQFAYLFYDRVAPEIRRVIDQYENESLRMISEQDRELVSYISQGRMDYAKERMTEFAKNRSAYMMRGWIGLGNYLLVKYMDGNIKKQNEDGSFKTSGYGVDIPEMPQQPAPREGWTRWIVKDCGENILVK